MGIQVTHDVAATSGLLLCAAFVTRAWTTDRFAPLDYATLALAMALVATRHNGMPTVAATAAGLLLVSGASDGGRHAALIAVAAGAAVITYGATRAAGHTESVHPIQTVEWLMADISCVHQRRASSRPRTNGRSLTAHRRPDRLAAGTRVPRHEPGPATPSFNTTAVASNYGD